MSNVKKYVPPSSLSKRPAPAAYVPVRTINETEGKNLSNKTPTVPPRLTSPKDKYKNKPPKVDIPPESLNIKWELEDFIYDYPTNPLQLPTFSQEISDFQSKISEKYEFAELTPDPNETVPKRSEFYNHQLLGRRFMSAASNDELLAIHDPGTGKTGLVAAVTEGFKEAHDRYHSTGQPEYTNEHFNATKSGMRKAYIILKNKTLVDEFKRQLVCKYSKEGTYDVTDITGLKTARSIKGELTKSLRSYYKILTYTDFRNEVRKVVGDTKSKFRTKPVPGKKDDKDDKDDLWNINDRREFAEIDNERIRDYYSGCLFVVDEAHNLTITEGGMADQAEGGSKGTDGRRILANYNVLHRVFHNTDRRKIILLTATPMVNVTSELVSLLNLIYPLDKQLTSDTFNVLYDTSADTFAAYAKYFDGYVTYIKSYSERVKVEYMGLPVKQIVENYDLVDPWYHEVDGKQYDSSMVLFPAEMKAYTREDGTPFGQDYAYSTIGEVKNVYKSDIYAGLGIGPEPIDENGNYTPKIKEDLSHTVTGVETFVKTKTGTKKKTQKNKVVNQASQRMVNLFRTQLEYISSKGKAIMDIGFSDRGTVYIYTDFYKDSGAVYYGEMFKAHGLLEFTEGSVFQNISVSGENIDRSGTSVGSSICGSLSSVNTQSKGGRKVNIPISDGVNVPWRFAILSQPNKSDHENILNVFNSWENRNGGLIKIIIVTLIGREGINLKHVLYRYMLNPQWNPANLRQAEDRCLRIDSHDDLLREWPEGQELVVKSYNLIAVPSLENNRRTSIDLKLYMMSERKGLYIKPIEMVMKSMTIDYYINKSRNDVEGLMCNMRHENGLDDTSLTCEGPSQYDYRGYYLLYSDKKIQEYKPHISRIMQKYQQCSILDLYRKMYPMNPKIIDLTLLDMIKNNYPMLDGFGRKAYLQERNDVLYITNSYPVSHAILKLETSYYTNIMTGILPKSLENISISNINDTVRILQDYLADKIPIIQSVLAEDIFSIVERFTQAGITDRILQLGIYVIINLVEMAMKGSISNPLSDVLMRLFSPYIYQYNKPTELIKYITEQSTKTGQIGRGRKKPIDVTKVDKNDLPMNAQRGDFDPYTIVYVHSLYKEVDRASSKQSGKYVTPETRLRILEVPVGGIPSEWRDADDYEKVAYAKLIQTQTESVIEDLQSNIFMEYSIFHSGDRKYTVRVQNGLTTEGKKGKDINTWQVPPLIYLYWSFLEDMEKAGHTNVWNINNVAMSDEDLRRELRNQFKTSKILFDFNTFDRNKLLFFYHYITNKTMLIDDFISSVKQFRKIHYA